jgi:hypothetical protein
MQIASHLIDRGPSKSDKIYQRGRSDMRAEMIERLGNDE